MKKYDNCFHYYVLFDVQPGFKAFKPPLVLIHGLSTALKILNVLGRFIKYLIILLPFKKHINSKTPIFN